ncbi:MAG: hypothetical protein BM564_12540 [Bacteroidetes bacterium MedPE-SWsnd-G2]|nr:MAG: hypothetical protein BM564_12540 [Bacteroidetes bacterium MedPE-SWsnd-G2]
MHLLKQGYFLIWFSLLNSCTNYGQLKVKADLSDLLNEVSAVEIVPGSNLLWMINDGGNKKKLYGLNRSGKIKIVIPINAKNNDWEDLASDPEGNLYIGDFGNNENHRDNLKILKVDKSYLQTDTKAEVVKTKFYYPEQSKFPPKKKKRFFDAESFFYFNGSFYIFTRSRVPDQFGKTTLYKVPAQKGEFEATKIGSFSHCSKLECSITSATINTSGTEVLLLTHNSILKFKGFKGDNFLSVDPEVIALEHQSQKEGICYKSSNEVYITDERTGTDGGNLYTFKLK